MANLVKIPSEFEIYKAMLSERFTNTNFEDNPFNDRCKYFMAFEFDFIFHESFFDGLKKFLCKIRNNSVVFYTIDPSPEEYFYKHFEKYSVFEISNTATDDELNEVIINDVGDSICISSDEIAWFSKSKEWAILGSRDWEIAVVGFENTGTKHQFLESFSEDAKTMFTSLQVQADALDEMLCFSENTRVAYQKLVDSYKDRVSE